MPHAFYIINCKRCNTRYCPVCKEKCPKCGKEDIVDKKIMREREQMRKHMDRDK